MKRVLIVDDDEQLLEFLDLAFDTSGYEVITCGSGEKGLELAKSTHPDLIILDVMMPEVDGYEVLWHVYSDPETADITTLMLTGRTKRSDRELSMQLGASDYLCKPIALVDIVERAENLLKARHKSQAQTEAALH